MLTRENIRETVFNNLFNDIIFGNTYNYFIGENGNKVKSNYNQLRQIAIDSSSVLEKIERSLVIEIETAT